MPVTGEENIFEALFKWGAVRSKEEDFYSKSFVLILKRLKRYDIKLATGFLHSLFKYEDFDLGGSDWDITDHTGKANRPDIILESDNALIYVEVKVSSKPDKDELVRYRSELNKKGKGRRIALLLLTRLGLEKDWGIPDQPQVSWVKVWRHLLETERKLKPKQGGPGVAPGVYFMVRDFRQFLKEKGMGVEQVSKIVSKESLDDLRKFLSVIRVGCEMANLKGGKLKLEGDAEESSLGWYFKEGRKEESYWCGFCLEEPMRVGLGVTKEVYQRLKDRMKREPELKQMLEKKFGWEDNEDNGDYGDFWFDLPKDFVSLGEERQLEFIRNSVSDILKNAIGVKLRRSKTP